MDRRHGANRFSCFCGDHCRSVQPFPLYHSVVPSWEGIRGGLRLLRRNLFHFVCCLSRCGLPCGSRFSCGRGEPTPAPPRRGGKSFRDRLFDSVHELPDIYNCEACSSPKQSRRHRGLPRRRKSSQNTSCPERGNIYPFGRFLPPRSRVSKS